MKEIRFHGRGGQGAVVGSEVLAQACFIEKKFAQAFPAFGVERRGAAVCAFLRVDDSPLTIRNQIYTPDHLVVLDHSLIKTTDVVAGLKPGGVVLINSTKDPSFYLDRIPRDYEICTVDAGGIALFHGLGSRMHPIVNTAILGAFCRVTRIVGLDSVQKAIEYYLPSRGEENSRAAEDAYNAVRSINRQLA